MRIIDAKNSYNAHLNSLRKEKEVLTDLLNQQDHSSNPLPDKDRVEISRKISEIDAECSAVQKEMDHISETHSILYQNAAIRQQSEDAIEGAKELGKILAIYRRICSGAEVPPYDERKLLEFSHELYFSAKAAAMLKQDDDKKYDSLWKDRNKESTPEQDPMEIADNASIAVPSPEVAASLAKANGT